MNLPTCADSEIALRDGNVVLAKVITVAFQNGCSVTVKMIVATAQMSFQSIVRNVRQRLTSSVATIDAFQSKKISFFF